MSILKAIGIVVLVGIVGMFALAGLGMNMQNKATDYVQAKTGETVILVDQDPSVLCLSDKVGIRVLTQNNSYPVCVGIFSEAVKGTEYE
jgi:hypothetical protein